MIRDYRIIICDCVINGVRQPYDGCSSGSLEEAKAFYKNYEYIGSNDGLIYVNGVKNDFNRKYHFFIKSSLKKIRLKKLKKLNDIS